MQRPILLHVCVVQKADEESRQHQQRMQQQSDDAEAYIAACVCGTEG